MAGTYCERKIEKLPCDCEQCQADAFQAALDAPSKEPLMDKDKLVELAERCEAATGSDDATDWAIAEAVGCAPGLSYTASLDAAMTLVQDSDVWCVSKQEHNPGRDYYYRANVMPFGPIAPSEAKAANPALALCAAALRSHAQPK